MGEAVRGLPCGHFWDMDMKVLKTRFTAVLLALVMFLGMTACGKRTSEDPLENAAFRAIDYLCKDKEVVFGAHWLTVSMRGWENLAPKKGWEESYANSTAEAAKECGGVFTTRKMTDQVRPVIGVTASGFDATDFEGYDLTLPLADYDMALLQGLNGASWALVALNYGGYEMPHNPDVPTQATEDMYIDYILSRQLTDGGFSFSASAKTGDPDMTGMVLLALSFYSDREDVKNAIDRAVSCLSALQDEDGGFTSFGEISAESCAQVILALTRLGIPLDDERFVKNSRTVLDKLLEYQNEDGGFSHIMGDPTNGVATEQALLAIVSTLRVQSGMTDIYSVNK